MRYDHSSLFGDNWNYRAGLVWSIADQVFAKLLSGSSYRAPSPEQLYGTPVAPGSVEGSLASSTAVSLKPQTAITQEVALGYETSSFTSLVSAYATTVKDRIEYVSQDGNLQPENLLNSQTLGVELSFQVHWSNLLDKLNVRLNAGGAYEQTTFSFESSLTPRQRRLLGVNELFPPLSGNFVLDAELPQYYVGLNVRVTGYSRRLQSQTNQSSGRSFVDDPLLYVHASYPLDLTLSSRGWKPLHGRETRLSLSVHDVLETASPDPGFNGINVPPLGRRFLVGLEQEF